MLREYRTRQIPGEPPRRWFRDDDFDLYVWAQRDGPLLGFQLCYDKRDDEHAFTFFVGCGATHHRVESERDVAKYGQSPILVAGHDFPAVRVCAAFYMASVSLDPAIREFVLAAMRPGEAEP